MATFSHTNSRRMYSWWWDSHISPKNSKWLQENLTDMDVKVKSMIKLIEEDADSFARRAEMYYKKRPELMKLVEEFYRAYRALAERYDHATGVIRHAHRTMAEAFPNQTQFMLDDSPANSASGPDPQKPEMSTPVRAFFEPDELQNEALGLSALHSDDAKRNGTLSEDGRVRKGLQFHEAVEKEKNIISNEKQNLAEPDQVGESEEILRLKKALAKVEAEKEAGLLQFQQSLEKLSMLESEIGRAHEDSKGLSEQASQVEAEAQKLKEALAKLEAEKEANLRQYRQCLDRISNLESTVSHAQEEAEVVNQRASKAEIEAQSLKDELAKVLAEKDAALDQYMSSLEMISNLEHKLQCTEEDAKKLKERAEKAENEVETLKQIISRLTEEKEAAELQYHQCLETISSLEHNLSSAEEEAKRLNSEMENGIENLKGAEERCLLLERSNQALHSELEAMMLKMGSQSQELTEKQKELGRLWTSIHEERLRFVEAETAFQTLQHLHAQAQEELRSLSSELQNKVQNLRETETHNKSLQDEVLKVNEENKTLNELSVSSAITIKDLQNEISSLTETKGNLEEEVELRVDQRNALQQEIYCLKEELNDFNKKHLSIMQQMHAVGLSAESFGRSVKDLQNDNFNLKDNCQRERSEKLALLKKLEILEKLLEKNSILENSLADLNAELEAVRGKIKALEESCQFLLEEKSSLLDDKASLQTQLLVANQNLQNLSEKNSDLENSLSDALDELQGMTIKSMSLEESCQLLVDENARVVTEKDVLISQLESTEVRLDNLEKKYAELGGWYSALEKEKESCTCKIQELQISLDVQKQEHATFAHVRETQLACMESEMHLLQDEIKLTKREFDKELDNSFKSQTEVFILRNCARDLEEKNFHLSTKNQNLFETSTQLACMESEMHLLQDEIKLTKREFDKELDNSFKSQTEVFILRNCARDLEEKNFHLSTKNQNLFETSTSLKKMLSELKHYNLSQKAEIISLSDQGSTLRKGIFQLLKALDIVPILDSEDSSGQDQTFLNHILSKLEDTKKTLFETEKENLQWYIELSILIAVLGQLRIDAANLELEKCITDQELRVRSEQLFTLQNEAFKLHEMNGELRSKLTEGNYKEQALTTQVSDLHKQLLELQGAYHDLQRENSEVLEEKESLTKEFLVLEKNNRTLEGENSVICGEMLSLGYLSSFFRNCVDEQSLELRTLAEDLDKLNGVNDDIRTRFNSTERKLEEVLIQKKMELLQLHEEHEKTKVREESLLSELQMARDDIDMWEAHASDFFEELQVSKLYQILYEEKLHQVTEACETYKDESTTKDTDIKLLKEREILLLSQIEGLNAQLTAYGPAITSLREYISSLEERTCLHGQLEIPENGKLKDAKVVNQVDENRTNENEEVVADPISDLMDLQWRIQSIEKAITQREQLMMQENQTVQSELEAAMRKIAEMKSESNPRRRNSKTKSEMSEVDNGLLPKDIMLDQISEFSPYRLSRREEADADIQNIESWETVDQDGSIDLTVGKLNKTVNPSTEHFTNFHGVKSAKKQKNELPISDVLVEKELGVDKLELSKRSTESIQEGNKRKVLERLNSDVQKLTNLHITVEDLKRKLQSIEKSKKGKAIDECDILKEQLEEAEAAIMKLFDLNGKLMKNMEGTPLSSHAKSSSMDSEESGSVRKRKTSEQARRISERIGRLQLEVQKIQFVLLKLDDEKDSKGKSRISETKRRVLLRDYLYGYGVIRSNHRRKKAPFCGCVQPRTEGD
ncbi:hypothetical protein ACH5RR_020193 [Cinchona calisaya]|uniref:NAB domain-containing protein n=1 Tax=Cinchona calisaya TaxID=153742 RepID=A0ABD2ZDQ4_9GENT